MSAILGLHRHPPTMACFCFWVKCNPTKERIQEEVALKHFRESPANSQLELGHTADHKE